MEREYNTYYFGWHTSPNSSLPFCHYFGFQGCESSVFWSNCSTVHYTALGNTSAMEFTIYNFHCKNKLPLSGFLTIIPNHLLCRSEVGVGWWTGQRAGWRVAMGGRAACGQCGLGQTAARREKGCGAVPGPPSGQAPCTSRPGLPQSPAICLPVYTVVNINRRLQPRWLG